MTERFMDAPSNRHPTQAKFLYEYILRGLAEDFWSVLKKEWIDTGQFRI
jgi:hypothetical protein